MSSWLYPLIPPSGLNMPTPKMALNLLIVFEIILNNRSNVLAYMGVNNEMNR